MARSVFRHMFVVMAAVAGLQIAPARAQGITLPGGATSLSEVHGDWSLRCAIAGQGERAHKVCAISQEQKDEKSGRRVVAVEVQHLQDTNVATLVLPFGLNLAAGAILQIDDGPASQPKPFRTCLMGGCIISSEIDAKKLAALRSGNRLKINAENDGGKTITFLISLKGFGAAFDRMASILE